MTALGSIAPIRRKKEPKSIPIHLRDTWELDRLLDVVTDPYILAKIQSELETRPEWVHYDPNYEDRCFIPSHHNKKQ